MIIMFWGAIFAIFGRGGRGSTFWGSNNQPSGRRYLERTSHAVERATAPLLPRGARLALPAREQAGERSAAQPLAAHPTAAGSQVPLSLSPPCVPRSSPCPLPPSLSEFIEQQDAGAFWTFVERLKDVHSSTATDKGWYACQRECAATSLPLSQSSMMQCWRLGRSYCLPPCTTYSSFHCLCTLSPRLWRCTTRRAPPPPPLTPLTPLNPRPSLLGCSGASQ